MTIEVEKIFLGNTPVDQRKFLLDIKCFDNFKKSIRKIARNEEIRNISAIVSKMSDIVLNHYNNLKENG